MAVMGLKTGTKSWNEKNMTGSSLSNSGGVPALSAQEKEALGADNLGEAANRLVDPNYVDPSKKMRGVGNDKLDKDAFMRLMLAQMKNQDPTNPLKSHEMAAQLASFSSLEQMQNMNTTLNDMKNGQKPIEQFQALNLIGKAVTGDSANLVRAKGDKQHDFQFHLDVPADSVDVKVRNADGDIIKKMHLQKVKAGDKRLVWSGEDDNGQNAPPGEYTFLVEAKNAEKKQVAVRTAFDGVITGVNYTPEGPVLMMGTQSIKLKDVHKIVDPSLKKNDQKTALVETPDLKKQAATQQNEDKPVSSKLEQNVGMSREMLNKLSKVK